MPSGMFNGGLKWLKLGIRKLAAEGTEVDGVVDDADGGIVGGGRGGTIFSQ